MRAFIAPRFHDPRGTLSVVDEMECPFPIKRVYYLYDIPGGEAQRGGHAHIKCHRLLFALSGSFEVHAETIRGAEHVTLNRPWEGVEILPLTWLELKEFSSGAVCLVLASTPYEADDYIRSREEWEKFLIALELMEKP